MTENFPVSRPSGCQFDPAHEYAADRRTAGPSKVSTPAGVQEVFARLYIRIPTLRLAVPFEKIQYKNNTLVYGVTSLPVTWT